jgi:uncharacterized protein (UPF0303 family)
MSIEDDKRDRDGIAHDDVSFYAADSRRLNTYEAAERQLSQLQTPIVVSRSNPHSRLYVAAFDGTGNDRDQHPDKKTNVARLSGRL